MGATTRRRLPGLIAAVAVAGGLAAAGPAMAASADAHGVSGTAKVCKTAGGKYQGQVIRTGPVGVKSNKDDTVLKTANLQIWRSKKCGTAWAKVIRVGSYAKKASYTEVFISFKYGESSASTGQVTKTSVQTAAIKTGPHRCLVAGADTDAIGPYHEYGGFTKACY